MAVKTIKLVRKIRDKHYKETSTLSVKEQLKLVREKSEKLKQELKSSKHSAA